MAVGPVFDTNVVLYHLGGRLSSPLRGTQGSVSIVTKLELLSYPDITPVEESHIRSFLNDLNVIALDPKICQSAIHLRRTYRIKLPDAIICATALTLGATLLTNDSRLAGVSEIDIESVALDGASDPGID